MRYTQEQLSRWIEKIDIDYTTYFMKAWLPFNAWYNMYFDNNSNINSDRAAINYLKNNSNPVRNSIETLVEGTGQESSEFKNYLAGLHHELEKHRLENDGQRISFTTIIKEKNTVNEINNRSYKRSKFYIKRTDGSRLGTVTQLLAVVKKTNGTAIFTTTINEYDFSLIETNSSYRELSDPRKEGLRLFFDDLKPYFEINLIEYDLQESRFGTMQNYYKCDNYNFKRDIENSCHAHYVCKAVIETLYALRNVLFHAELRPSADTLPIYKNAYFLLKMILDKLRR